MRLVSTICWEHMQKVHFTFQHGGRKLQRKVAQKIAWKDVKELIQIMQEETVMFSLDNAKTPKEKRAAYKTVQVQMQKKGKLIDVYAPGVYAKGFQ